MEVSVVKVIGQASRVYSVLLARAQDVQAMARFVQATLIKLSCSVCEQAREAWPRPFWFWCVARCRFRWS